MFIALIAWPVQMKALETSFSVRWHGFEGSSGGDVQVVAEDGARQPATASSAAEKLTDGRIATEDRSISPSGCEDAGGKSIDWQAGRALTPTGVEAAPGLPVEPTKNAALLAIAAGERRSQAEQRSGREKASIACSLPIQMKQIA